MGRKNSAAVKSLASPRLPPMWPGVQIPVFAPYLGWVSCWFSPLRWEFFSGYYGFFSPQKPTFPHWFQFDQESGKRRTTQWMCYLWIVIYLLILFIHNVINLPLTATVEELTLDINGVIGSFSVATSFCIRESLIMKFVALVSCKNKIYSVNLIAVSFIWRLRIGYKNLDLAVRRK